MTTEQDAVTEALQRHTVRLLASSPAGAGLCLIGGYRYRLLDTSCRRSIDIDYHWPEELEAKQAEVEALLRRKLLPLIQERMGLAGSIRRASGPEADSPTVKTVEIAVWEPHGTLARVTIPVDLTRIVCEDQPVVRTVEGVIYLSVSDADMIESKVLSLFCRLHLAERDLVDLFLFQSQLVPDASVRLARKVAVLALDPRRIARVVQGLSRASAYHVRRIEQIISEQLEPDAAANLRVAGGGAAVYRQVMDILGRLGFSVAGHRA